MALGPRRRLVEARAPLLLVQLQVSKVSTRVVTVLDSILRYYMLKSIDFRSMLLILATAWGVESRGVSAEVSSQRDLPPIPPRREAGKGALRVFVCASVAFVVFNIDI